MTLLRVLLAWILLVALPLQGYAAAAMLYCGTGGSHAAMAVEHGEHAPDHEAASTARSHTHDQHAQVAHHGHPGDDTGRADRAAGGTLPDLDHQCSVCAACSHSVALADTPHVIAAAVPQRTSGMHDFGPFPTRPAPVPDKPPRA